MPGQLIAIEGIDGAGKGTQAKLLHERFRAEGVRSALLSFPRYSETKFGSFVGEYLNGRFGSLDEVHPFLASLLFSGDRFESRQVLLDALAASDVVICDRYVASNIAHQASKLEGSERAELIQRIETVEHDIFGLPRADVTICLDLPVTVAQRLIASKAARSYTDRAADLHEADADYLERVREVYASVMKRTQGNCVTISCSHEGAVRPREEIAQEIWQWHQKPTAPSMSDEMITPTFRPSDRS